MIPDGSQFTIAILCYFYKTVIIIVKLCFVTVRKNFCNSIPTAGETALHIVFRDVVSTAFDPVVDSCKTFRQGVQSYIEHSDMITQLFNFLSSGFRLITGKGGLLCEGYITINAITDHG